MKFTYLTLFPDIIQNYFEEGLISKALRDGIIQTEIHNIRDAVTTSYKTVDDTAYGGGEGTVMMYEPLKKTLEKVVKKNTIRDEDSSVLDQKKTLTIYLSPQGQVLDQALIRSLLRYDHLILISGRYAGVDQRFINECVDLEVSIGDYVLNGGELASLVLTESVARFIPGVLGHALSAQNDSFAEGLNGWLEAPQFTKPSQLSVKAQVPEVLLSGNHKKIVEWKNHVSKLVTLKKRKDLFEKLVVKLSRSEVEALKNFYMNELSAVEKKILQIENLDELLVAL